MAGNIELLSNTDNFTIGTNSNLEEILANVVKIGRDTSNVTLSIPQDINSSYNLILPARQGASGESLVYNKDGQLIWHDPTVLKQVISVYGPNLTGNLSSTGTQDSPTYLENYIASITPKSSNSKIFVQFKVNYHASLSQTNQISFYIKKTDNNGNTISIFSESLFGPYNGAGGFTGQYISNLVDQATSTEQITYQLGYKVNGNVLYSDVLGILGYDTSYNNTIVLQEFEGSGSNATSVWNKGADSNGLYYNDGTVHIGSTKNAPGSQSTPGVALELSGNLLGTNANFSGNITAHSISVEDAHIGRNTLYMNGTRVLNQNENGSVNVYADQIVSDASNGLTIKAIGDNGSIILDPSGTGSIQLNGYVELSDGNIRGNVTGHVTGTVSSLSNLDTDDLSEGSTNKYYTATLVRGDVSGGTGINYNESTGVFSLPQEVSTTSNVQFNNVTIDGTLNSDDITGSNVTVSNDLVVSGNLTVNGTRTVVNATTLDIGDNKIVVNAAGSITDAGIIANVSGTEHEFVYSTNNNAWGTIGDLNIGSNVTATTFIGDGSQLTGITDTTYSAGTGLSLVGTTFNNTAPDQTVIISGSGSTTVSGTYPNFTISSTARGDVSGGTGINYNESTGVFSLPQEVSITSNVQFNNVTIDGTLDSDYLTTNFEPKFITDQLHIGTFSVGNSFYHAKAGLISTSATWAHNYYFNEYEYAFQQGIDGQTIVNAKEEQFVSITVGGSIPCARFSNTANYFYKYVNITTGTPVPITRVRFALIANSDGYWVAPENNDNVPITGNTYLALRCDSGCYAAHYYTSSDDRRKHNEAKFADGDGLRIINKLQPLIYEKTDKLYEIGETRDPEEDYIIEAGFIAQEVLKIPELSFAVRGGDYVNEEGENVKQEYALDYQSIWTVAVKAIQELSAEITQLKERIAQLEGN